MTDDRRTLWAEVTRALGLAPTGWEEGALLCAGDHLGARLTVRVGVGLEGLPVRVVLRLAEGGPGGILLLPTRSALHAPAVRTGDAAFDAEVALVLGGETVLPWLDARTRGAVAAAAGLGAVLGADTAILEPPDTARLRTAASALAAIRTLVDAIRALRASSEASLVERYGVDDGASEVTRAVAAQVDASLHRLSVAEAARFGRLVVQRGDDPEAVLGPLVAHRPAQHVLLAHRPGSRLLLEQARREWAEGDPWLAGALFRARVAAGAIGDLHDLPGFATLLDDEGLEGAVLDADEARPGSVDDLLVQLEPRSRANLDRLVGALARSQHPRVDRRLRKLLPRDAPRIAPILVDRVRAALADGRAGELEDLREVVGIEPLFELLLTLPDAAAPWLASLRPESDARQIQLLERLAGCPHPRVEEALLDRLAHGLLPVRRAAAAALAEVGAGAALPALEELASGWLVDGELRAAARRSAGRIRERHAAGGLSLARGSGALSEVRRPDGTLRLVDPERED